MVLKLASFFEQGEKQNGFHYHTYCKDCLKHYLVKKEAGAAECAHLSTQSLDQQEANLMKAIAEMDEDERLNGGAIKIPLDSEQWV